MEDLLVDGDVLANLVAQALSHSDEHAFEQLYHHASQYAERPQLLDGFLKQLLAPVITHLQSQEFIMQQRAARIFYFFSKVRGASAVAKLLPHEVDLVVEVSRASFLQHHQGSWEVQYVYLLWLSELAIFPLAANRIHPDLVFLVELGRRFLCVNGKPSDAAQLFLARLLTRHDMLSHLSNHIHWTVSKLDSTDADVPLLSCLCKIFQIGARSLLLPLAPVAFAVNLVLDGASVVRRKIVMKLVQRIGLVFLAPRLAPWRYQRSHRVLLAGVSVRESQMNDQSAQHVTWKVPEQLDRVVDMLLTGLRDKDTVVRWSSAKGIGRITERLPMHFADFVVEAVMELCSPSEEESAWHGSCLALAELARRGLLLPQRLAHVMPAVLNALRFDVKQGARSVGSQVRDAACYVLWACARAYAPAILEPHTITIAGALLECAALDREVNCRRAASAAFQEHVGRVGLIAHGLDLVQATDYFVLGSLRSSFLQVGPVICNFSEYGPWLVDTLVERKICHWDVTVRDCASRLLGRIASFESCQSRVLALLPKIRSLSVHPEDPDLRHGGLLALGRVARALKQLTAVDVATVVPELEAARLFRGKGGELVRVAACTLTRCLAQAEHPLTLDMNFLKPHLKGRPDSGKTSTKRHKEFLDECLRTSSESVQDAAARALRPFCLNYLSKLDDKVKAAVVKTYCDVLLQENPLDQVASHSRGCARALRALPPEMFSPQSLHLATEAICAAISKSTDAETRQAAVLALRPSSGSVAALKIALTDYAMDERGDVGSWVREAACEVLPSLVHADCNWNVSDVDDVVSSLLEILVGRMDRLRISSLSSLKIILKSMSPPPTFAKDLSAIFDAPSDDSHWVIVARCLAFPAHRKRVFLSFCVSAGLRTPDPAARDALLSFVSSGSKDLLALLWNDSIELLKERCRDERVLSHLLACLDAIVRNGCFDTVAAQQDVGAFRAACWNAFHESSSVQLLCVGMDLACALLRFSFPVAWLHQIVQLVGHRYPRVRQHACLQLQLQLASQGDGLCRNADTLEKLQSQFIVGSTSEDSILPKVEQLLGISSDEI